MRTRAALLSAAVLIGPGCGSSVPSRSADRQEPVRRASFRSLAARDFLTSCPGAAARRETAYQMARLEELKQLAARNGAGRAVALGENEWAGLGRYASRQPCAAGEPAFRRAIANFGQALDALAAHIADYPSQAGARP